MHILIGILMKLFDLLIVPFSIVFFWYSVLYTFDVTLGKEVLSQLPRSKIEKQQRKKHRERDNGSKKRPVRVGYFVCEAGDLHGIFIGWRRLKSSKMGFDWCTFFWILPVPMKYDSWTDSWSRSVEVHWSVSCSKAGHQPWRQKNEPWSWRFGACLTCLSLFIVAASSHMKRLYRSWQEETCHNDQ